MAYGIRPAPAKLGPPVPGLELANAGLWPGVGKARTAWTQVRQEWCSRASNWAPPRAIAAVLSAAYPYFRPSFLGCGGFVFVAFPVPRVVLVFVVGAFCGFSGRFYENVDIR